MDSSLLLLLQTHTLGCHSRRQRPAAGNTSHDNRWDILQERGASVGFSGTCMQRLLPDTRSPRSHVSLGQATELKQG